MKEERKKKERNKERKSNVNMDDTEQDEQSLN
jgi:hypothetical protein